MDHCVHTCSRTLTDTVFTSPTHDSVVYRRTTDVSSSGGRGDRTLATKMSARIGLLTKPLTVLYTYSDRRVDAAKSADAG